MKKTMKRTLAATMAATLVLSTGITVFADTTTEFVDATTVTIKNSYLETNEGTTSPAETFKFSIKNTSVTDSGTNASGAAITVENMPTPTVGNVSYSVGEAGKAEEQNVEKKITITLPKYDSVGIYTYTINETIPEDETAGVTYYSKDIVLKVTVIEQKGKVRVAAVHTEDGAAGTAEAGTKLDTIKNEYSAGSLSVKKNVTGNMGDQNKDFEVKVTFTAPTDKTVMSDISYEVDGKRLAVSADTDTEKDGIEGWTGTKEVTLNLKHDETVTFNNIPYGVTYAVVESDYTAEANGGYDVPTYTLNDNEASNTAITAEELDNASESVVITNNKGVNVDTGISLDSMPYFMMLALAAAGMFGFAFKKREDEI